MTQTLFTNSPDVAGHNFKREFKSKITNSKELIIASGYFGVSSITEHQSDIVNLSKFGICKILVGMVFHGGLTKKQKEVLIKLDDRLRKINSSNGVYISIKPYHGKIYFFRSKTDDTESLYLGSSNFSEEGFASRHECTALIQHEQTKDDVTNYLAHLFNTKIAKPLGQVELRVKTTTATAPASKLLEDYKISAIEYPDAAKSLGVCYITLRVDDQPNSSLNLYFDKGRKNPKTGLYAPRPWYEIEITSSKTDRESPFYPKSRLIKQDSKARKGTFTAYAKDDENFYKFTMGVYSDNGKAISTLDESGGRTTLGMFIKGKLERCGLLSIGERITSDTLLEYGKNTIDFIKISDDVYILDF